MLKHLKGYRTLAWNAIGALALAALSFDWTPFFGPDALKWVMLVQTAGNVVLRFVTTAPIGQGEAP